MNFLVFQNKLSHLSILSKSEINKTFLNLDRNALTRWQKKGYLQKIRNGFYRFTDRELHGNAALFFTANCIYKPSYVSLQSALSYYGFIPEGVFTITSVSSLKTNRFNTELGTFNYQKIKRELFLGYRLLPYKDFYFKIATPAKAMFDLLYFYPEIKTEADFHELRFNYWELREQFSEEEFISYLYYADNKALTNRGLVLNKFIKANDVD